MSPADPAAIEAAWCAHLASLFNARYADDADGTAPVAMKTWKLHDIIVGEMVNPAQHLERGEAMIARQELDHLLLQFQERGSIHVRTAERRSVVEAGQLLVLDLSRAVSIDASAGTSTTLLIPRRLMPGDRAATEALHGQAFDYQTDRVKRLFHTYLRGLVETGDVLKTHHLPGVSQAASHLCSACFGPDVPGWAGPDADVNTAIRQYIQSQLTTSDLGTDSIIARFGISRATLYRLFQQDGGVANYIRDLRLARAMKLLTLQSDLRRPRVSAVAYATGFTDEKTFSRAFKRRFGFVPRKAVGSQPSSGRPNDNPSELLHWMKSTAV